MHGEQVCTNLIKNFITHNFTGASWPASSNLATFLEACSTVGFVAVVDLYFFWANISHLFLPISFFNATFCRTLSLWRLVYHCFSTSWALGFAEFVVDFVHNLHFQVKREKCECHAVAHHSLNTQASGTNNIKSTTELSPVLIRILLRFQNVASTRLLSVIIAALHQKKREWEGLKASLIIEAVDDCFVKYF